MPEWIDWCFQKTFPHIFVWWKWLQFDPTALMRGGTDNAYAWRERKSLDNIYMIILGTMCSELWCTMSLCTYCGLWVILSKFLPCLQTSGPTRKFTNSKYSPVSPRRTDTRGNRGQLPTTPSSLVSPTCSANIGTSFPLCLFIKDKNSIYQLITWSSNHPNLFFKCNIPVWQQSNNLIGILWTYKGTRMHERTRTHAHAYTHGDSYE